MAKNPQQTSRKRNISEAQTLSSIHDSKLSHSRENLK